MNSILIWICWRTLIIWWNVPVTDCRLQASNCPKSQKEPRAVVRIIGKGIQTLGSEEWANLLFNGRYNMLTVVYAISRVSRLVGSWMIIMGLVAVLIIVIKI